MAKLGYNPENAISAHKNLEKVSQEYMKLLGKNTEERGFFEDLLSTHPRTSVRMYKTAIPHLNLFAEVQPRHPEIHGILGICYENINDLYSAYDEYVMQLKVNPTNEMGRHAASRVGVLRLILEGSRIRR